MIAIAGVELETLVSEIVSLGKTLNANIPTSGGTAQ